MQYQPEFGGMPSILIERIVSAGGRELYYHGLEGHAPLAPGPEVRSTYTFRGSDFVKIVHLGEEQVAAMITLAERVVVGCPAP